MYYWKEIILHGSWITKIVIFSTIFLGGILGGILLAKKKYISLIVVHIIFFAIFFYSLSPRTIDVWVYLQLVPSLFVNALSFLIAYALLVDPKPARWRIVIKTKRGRALVMKNIKRGIAIFGSAGAGKTESIFIPILKHVCDFGFAGISYDYKNGEMTEYANYFFSQNEGIKDVNIILDDPKLSHRINPIDPIYLKSIDDVANFVKVFFINMKDKDQKSVGFFDKVPQAALRGVIWRLKNDYPQYCTLPHAIAICLMKQLKQLAEFIAKDNLARLTAAPFFSSFDEAKEGEVIGAGANDQLRGVKASLDNVLSELVSPNLFYILSASDFNLELNNEEQPVWMNIANNPAKIDVFSPYIAFIINVALAQMQDRAKHHSLLLFDEAPTLRLPNFSRIPSTLRGFNIATVYCTQDIALADETQGRLSTKGILANLSYQHVGKTNDPESIKYYKALTEEVKEKETSKTSTGAFNAPRSKTESFRYSSKYKTQDYMGLNQGEFIVYSDGKDRKVDYKLLEDFGRKKLDVIHPVTEFDIKANFDKIIEIAKQIE